VAVRLKLVQLSKVAALFKAARKSGRCRDEAAVLLAYRHGLRASILADYPITSVIGHCAPPSDIDIQRSRRPCFRDYLRDGGGLVAIDLLFSCREDVFRQSKQPLS
jgi:hypothetical protein